MTYMALIWQCECCGSYSHETDACPEWTNREHPDAWQLYEFDDTSDVIGRL